MAEVEVIRPLSAEQLFDEVGPKYEPLFEGLATQAAAVEWLKTELNDKKPAKFLDIGCGTGRPVCLELANAGHDVLGIDISGVMIEDARKNVPNATFDRVDIGSYKPAKSSYDGISVFFSLIASVTQEQIRQYAQNIYDWLKHDGVFAFGTVPISGNNLEIKWMGRPIVVSSLDAEEFLSLFKSVGFEIVHHEMSAYTPKADKAAESGLCKAEDVWEEPHLFIYARKQ